MFGLVITIASLLYFAINAEYDVIECGDVVYGETTNMSRTANYTFRIDDGNDYYVTFSSCNSSYDTYLYLYDEDGDLIRKCDDCGACGTRTVLKSYQQLSDGDYMLTIGGFYNDYGDYHIKIYCDQDTQPTADPDSFNWDWWS